MAEYSLTDGFEAMVGYVWGVVEVNAPALMMFLGFMAGIALVIRVVLGFTWGSISRIELSGEAELLSGRRVKLKGKDNPDWREDLRRPSENDIDNWPSQAVKWDEK